MKFNFLLLIIVLCSKCLSSVMPNCSNELQEQGSFATSATSSSLINEETLKNIPSPEEFCKTILLEHISFLVVQKKRVLTCRVEDFFKNKLVSDEISRIIDAYKLADLQDFKEFLLKNFKINELKDTVLYGDTKNLCASMRNAAEFSKGKVLFVLDIDRTIMKYIDGKPHREHCTTCLHDHYMKKRSLEGVNLDKFPCNCEDDFDLTEKELPQCIQELQEKGHIVIALTARGMPCKYLYENNPKRFNVFFSPLEPFCFAQESCTKMVDFCNFDKELCKKIENICSLSEKLISCHEGGNESEIKGCIGELEGASREAIGFAKNNGRLSLPNDEKNIQSLYSYMKDFLKYLKIFDSMYDTQEIINGHIDNLLASEEIPLLGLEQTTHPLQKETIRYRRVSHFGYKLLKSSSETPEFPAIKELQKIAGEFIENLLKEKGILDSLEHGIYYDKNNFLLTHECLEEKEGMSNEEKHKLNTRRDMREYRRSLGEYICNDMIFIMLNSMPAVYDGVFYAGNALSKGEVLSTILSQMNTDEIVSVFFADDQHGSLKSVASECKDKVSLECVMYCGDYV